MPLNLPLEPFEVEISGLSSHGEGVARYENKVIFVLGALPGEKCKIQIVSRYRKMARASIVELLQPSPARVNPPCPHYPACGGCQIQHLNYSEQLAYKQQTVSDALSHLAKLDILPTAVIAGKEFAYRNKMTFPLTVDNGRIAVGLHPRDAYQQIVPIKNCLLLEEPLQQILEPIVEAINQAFSPEDVYMLQTEQGNLRYLILRSFNGILAVGLVLREKKLDNLNQFAHLVKQLPDISTVFIHLSPDRNDYLWTEEKTEILFGEKQFPITLTLDLKEIPFSAEAESIKLFGFAGVSTFLQVNAVVAEKLYEYILHLPISGNQVAIDTYCGIGLLALGLAKRFNYVIGIDSDTSAIRFAHLAVQSQKISNIEFIAGPAEKVFRVWKKEGHFLMPEFLSQETIQRLLDLTDRIELVILDPPRSGIHPKVIKRLGELLPNDIILVSCHPATLARDLSLIIPFGYQVLSVQPFDMFPQTFHVETVAHLQKES
ncbi:MAG: 23S rRNA (uracil(1939)-C(5))-methyltransferase RlmD [bacterium]|nr:23S rRNA (uracil(1939)-C(5))-methyltransferase RlmD [bacterium]